MSKMYKALCVIDPVGEMIASGKKTIEVCGWGPGEISPGQDLLIVQRKVSPEEGSLRNPSGRALALVCLKEIRPFVYADRAAAKTERFEEGLWAWVFSNPRRLAGRVNVHASHGIYEVDLDETEST